MLTILLTRALWWLALGPFIILIAVRLLVKLLVGIGDVQDFDGWGDGAEFEGEDLDGF
jgi:hypothetical protein